MAENKIFLLTISVIIAITTIIGALIATNLFTIQWKKELLQLSLEKGQNPMYVKCAMEEDISNECKVLITALAVDKSN